MQFIDETGKRYGRLTILSFSHFEQEGKGRRPFWNCQCDCGKIVKKRSKTMKNGDSLSCGCIRRETTTAKNYVHGSAPRKACSPEYKTWCDIIKRTENQKYIHFKNYGGRGITVCERWRNSYSNFLGDMGQKPSPKHSIERINNEGDYEPSNCCWATQKAQCRNKRNNHKITHEGTTLCLGAWAEKLGMNYMTLYSRIRKGWTISESINTPVIAGRKTRIS